MAVENQNFDDPLDVNYYSTVESQDLINFSFIDACEEGVLSIAKHLLTSDKLVCKAQIDAESGKALYMAAAYGQFDIVDYLLNDTSLEKNIDISISDDAALRMAAKYENWDMFKYLLTSPTLKKHANVHAEFDMVILDLIDNGNKEILYFLLENNKINKDSEIFNHPEIQRIHNSIELNKDLNKNLKHNESTGNKLKI